MGEDSLVSFLSAMLIGLMGIGILVASSPMVATAWCLMAGTGMAFLERARTFRCGTICEVAVIIVLTPMIIEEQYVRIALYFLSLISLDMMGTLYSSGDRDIVKKHVLIGEAGVFVAWVVLITAGSQGRHVIATVVLPMFLAWVWWEMVSTSLKRKLKSRGVIMNASDSA